MTTPQSTGQQTFAMEYTQLIPPNGEQRTLYFSDAPVELESYYNRMREAEVLNDPYCTVSLTIADREASEDYDIELVQNGPEVSRALEKMLKRFVPDEHKEWRRERGIDVDDK